MINFQFPKKLAKIFPFFLVFLGLVLYFHNFFVFPPTRGSDSGAHLQYIKYLVYNRRIPRADEGFEMYQPSLYYSLAAIFFSLGSFLKLSDPLKLSQSISLLSALGNITLVFLISKKLFKSSKTQILVTLFSIFLPMHLYESPVVSNEMFLSFLSSLAIYYFLINKWEKHDKRKIIILGIITAMTCLTKYSGIILSFVFAAIFLINFFFKKERKYLLDFFIFIFTVLVLSGWFYLRQYLFFGNPLILANDPQLFPYWQEPGYRDWHFYLNLTGLIPLKVFGGPMESFWAGTYNTIWVDTHRTFLPVVEFSRAGAAIIYLGLLPTFIFILGLFKTIKLVASEKNQDKYLFISIFSIFSFLIYLLYTYKLPIYSSVKTFYLLGNILPTAIYFGLGLEIVIKWLKSYRWTLYLWLVILTSLIFKLYWYQSWWKNIGE